MPSFLFMQVLSISAMTESLALSTFNDRHKRPGTAALPMIDWQHWKNVAVILSRKDELVVSAESQEQQQRIKNSFILIFYFEKNILFSPFYQSPALSLCPLISLPPSLVVFNPAQS